MKLTLIAAVAENGVIGYRNALPWRVPADLRYFKSATLGKPILMGRRTWDSIGRPLPGRTNIVLTRDPGWARDGVLSATTMTAAIELAVGATSPAPEELMVIGGEEIYRIAEPVAARMLLTEIHARPEGDAFFPTFDTGHWERVSCEPHLAGAENSHDFSFCEWRRKQ